MFLPEVISLADISSETELIAEGPEGIGIILGGAGGMDLADSSLFERARMVAALEDMDKASGCRAA